MINLPDITGMVVAVDTETSGLYVDDGARVSIVSAAWRAADGHMEAHAWPFDQGASDKPGAQPSLLDPDVNLGKGDWVQLMTWLERQRLVFHKAQFDLPILEAGHRVWGSGWDLLPNTVWCTKIGQWVLDPQFPSSLKPSAVRLWGEGEDDEQAVIKPLLKKNKNRFDLLPWEVVGPYAAKDAEMTLRLFEMQQQRLAEGEGHLIGQIEMELDVMRCLVRMNRRGIGYWVERSRMEAAKARALMAQVDAELPFSPPTPARARKWFFEERMALPHCITPSGSPSIGECCVLSLIAQQVEGAEAWATRLKLTNAIGKYYDGYADATGPDGRLRTDFKQEGTVTMRFSSQRVNLQAMPHTHRMSRLEGIVPPRDLFRPAPGTQLWEFDLAQAEARVAAKIAGCQAWLEIFESGGERDLHGETADQLFGTREFKYRQIAKQCNFALIYGTGPATFARVIEKQTGEKLLDAQAKQIVADWNKLYPEFKQIAARATRVATARRYVKLVDGRIRYFTPLDELHKAFNAVVQGSIGQFTKRWMLQVDEIAPVLLQIHDSVCVEIPVDRVDQACEEICREGGALATEFFGVPMAVDSKRWMTLSDDLDSLASGGVS